jgi:hypothetical protein
VDSLSGYPQFLQRMARRAIALALCE